MMPGSNDEQSSSLAIDHSNLPPKNSALSSDLASSLLCESSPSFLFEHSLIIHNSFVICNDGFTIECFIYGMDAAYNDIQPWTFKDLVSVFGAKEGTAKTFQIKTKEQVHELF